MTGLYTLQARVKLGRCFLIPFRILSAAALTSSKPTKMGSSDSPVTGFHKSANLFTNPETHSNEGQGDKDSFRSLSVMVLY